MNWSDFLKDKKLITRFTTSVIGLIIILFLMTHFLNFIEQRQGVILNDPLLNMLQPINLTWLIFTVIYLSLILTISLLIKNPMSLLFAIRAYSVMISLRIIAMYLLPLNPPAGMILLNDPFVQFFGSGNILTKDLFFSGHTATLFLFYLLIDNKIYKNILLVLTIIIAYLVLAQHVHYSIDVFAAPFFSYAAYKIVGFLSKSEKLR